jgi:hypothetical protein
MRLFHDFHKCGIFYFKRKIWIFLRLFSEKNIKWLVEDEVLGIYGLQLKLQSPKLKTCRMVVASIIGNAF